MEVFHKRNIVNLGLAPSFVLVDEFALCTHNESVTPMTLRGNRNEVQYDEELDLITINAFVR